ncbi:MAG: 4'-phosphopantetheinyl transferase superfamily protein [Cytophagales bacterium]|nr:4'-phosphopantetheinyl transferase superfamily protein [Cytophagales bacterium]
MTEIKLIYVQFPEPLETSIYQYYLEQLPKDLQSKNARYHRWQDRHLHLFGKILLIRLAIEFGIGSQVLSQLAYTKHDRPYLEGEVDFNISHTGTTVACAITRGAKVGLDIERFSEVEISDFGRIHNSEQWNQIKLAKDPQKAFFDFWTVKESVIKADGKGLSIPLDQILIDQNRAFQGNHQWYLQRLDLEDTMACCVASDQKEFKIITEKISREQIYARNVC